MVQFPACDRLAIGPAPRFQCHGHDRFRPPKVPWLLGSNRLEGRQVLLYILQGRSDVRDGFFFSFRFGFSLSVIQASHHHHTHLTTTLLPDKRPPRSLTTTRTQQSLLPATAPCEQSILDFPDHTCRILLPEARFCSRATKSQTPDVSS